MIIEVEPFGQIDNQPISLFTFKNSSGSSLKVMNYGAIITSLSVSDKEGHFRDVTLGFDNLNDYRNGHPYFGATIGRVGNRIAGSRFVLNGKKYQLASNQGVNHLHGGLKGFDKVVWTPEIIDNSLVLTYLSPDGEEGYPGTLNVSIRYSFTEENELQIAYNAVCDEDTLVNLTNHSYFNLNGEGAETIEDHFLIINADHYLATKPDSIPTGEIRAVADTAFDFRTRHLIGERISSDDEQLHFAGGYDHNYVLNHTDDEPGFVSRVESDSSGIIMEVYSTEPGVQFYSGNKLNGSIKGKSGIYKRRSGFCLETQKFPDAIHFPDFPETVLKKDTNYSSQTIYNFVNCLSWK